MTVPVGWRRKRLCGDLQKPVPTLASFLFLLLLFQFLNTLLKLEDHCFGFAQLKNHVFNDTLDSVCHLTVHP